MLGVGFRVLGVGCWVLGVGCWVLGFGCWVLGFGCWVSGVGFRVLGFGCWVALLVPMLCVGTYFRPLRTPFRPWCGHHAHPAKGIVAGPEASSPSETTSVISSIPMGRSLASKTGNSLIRRRDISAIASSSKLPLGTVVGRAVM